MSGFVAEAIYTGLGGARAGGLWRHQPTGLELRLLAIDSVPQAFIHVHAPPVGDGGESHAGEHLLLGKGARGKALAAEEELALVESTAFTAQTEVCYAFNCAAGQETFFRILAGFLEALLFPDYTDEEVRREVCHLAAVRDPGTGRLALEEQGTVYTEMVATCEKRWIVFHELHRRLFGAAHPLGFVAGGTPEGIRRVTPADLHRFHAAHYHLAGMGLILALPPALPEADTLRRLDELLGALAARPAHQERPRERRALPPLAPEPPGTWRVPYPNQNERDTGTLVMAWAARLPGDLREHLRRRLLLEPFADGETSWLHRAWLDRKSRKREVPASRVYGGLDLTPLSEGAQVGLIGLGPEGAAEGALAGLRAAVREELEELLGLPAADPRRATFQGRAEARLLDLERSLLRRLSAPPLFGRRGAGGFWREHLRLVDRAGGAERSLLLEPALGAVRRELAEERLDLRAVAGGLGLLDEEPHVLASYACPAEIERRATARGERLRAALEGVRQRFGEDEQAALAGLHAEDEAAAAALEARDRAIPPPALVEDVPRTLDDGLDWEQGRLGGLPLVRGRFATSPTIEVSLAVRVEAVRPEELSLLPLVPSLLTGLGLRSQSPGGQGEVLPYDALHEALERETAGVWATWDLRPDRDRRELLLGCAGLGPAEARRALGWLGRCALETDLSPENLPRLRELVEQAARDLRGALGRSEEGWVRNPAAALRFQRDPQYLAVSSLFTQLHLLARLRWRLAEPPAAGARAALDAALEALREGLRRGEAPDPLLRGLTEAGPGGAPSAAAASALTVLGELLSDLPPATRGEDLALLIEQAASDLARPPEETLVRLRGLTDLFRPRPGAARLVLSGAPDALAEVEPAVLELLGRLAAAGPVSTRPEHPQVGPPLVSDRVRARAAAAGGGLGLDPVHWGLVHETGSTATLVLSAELCPFATRQREALLDMLAGSLDAGGGPHGFFMRTWGAGLAYSNGLRVMPLLGRVSYYAERCPDPAQTMRFVLELARDERRLASPALVDYALAQLVGASRAADRFESRVRAQAADLEDGLTPARVAAQREALLALAREPGLHEELLRRRAAVLGRVLPGLGDPARAHPDAVHLAIAPQRLLGEWERLIGEHEPDERLACIWPADFWLWSG